MITKRWMQRSAVAAVAAGIVLCAALSFCLTPTDAQKLRDFDAAVLRWQSNPDFRAVTREYVALGVRAMQARLCGVPAATVILKFRSLPGLPATLAVNPTSESHYRDFSSGELPAYLHLCDEQGVEDFLPTIESMLNSPAGASDEQIIVFLRSFQMPVPIASDAGAVQSVRALLADVRATPVEFAVRTRLGRPLLQYVPLLNGPQSGVLARLDGIVRLDDPQLWRTKQVSDLLSGIWAQGYGQIYSSGIVWLFRIRAIARLSLIALIVAGAFLLRRTAVLSKGHAARHD